MQSWKELPSKYYDILFHSRLFEVEMIKIKAVTTPFNGICIICITSIPNMSLHFLAVADKKNKSGVLCCVTVA